MPRVERQITVNVPVEQVFSYVSDLTRHAEWAQHPLEISKTSEGPVSQGSTFKSGARFMGQHNADITVTEMQPNSKIVYECSDDTGVYRNYFEVRSEDGGTLLVKGVEPVRPALMFRLLLPIAGLFIIPRGLDTDLRRIKERLEGGSAQPAAQPASEAASPAEPAAAPKSPEPGEPGQSEESS